MKSSYVNVAPITQIMHAHATYLCSSYQNAFQGPAEGGL